MVMQVGMNPMKLPQGLEEELALLDELGEFYSSQPDQAGQPSRGLRPINPKGPIQPGSSSHSSSRSRGSNSSGSINKSSRLKDLQKLNMPGMSLHSAEEFRRQYNVQDDE